MARLIESPKQIIAAGNKSKVIEEFIGRINSGTEAMSIAHMHSPAGWTEPGQTPAFDEYTVVLHGVLHVDTTEAEFDVTAGQAVIASTGQWVRYSTPSPEGADYMAVCVPAFSQETVHRDGT